jgi:hypothetical protein
MGWWVVVLFIFGIRKSRTGLDWTAFDAVDCSPESFAFRYLYLPTLSFSAFHIAEREIEVFGCQSLFDLHLNI